MNMIISLLYLFVCLFIFTACGKENPVPPKPEEPFEIIMAEDCNGINETLFDSGEKRSVIQSPPLSELSGIVPSIANPGYYWTHNDSGNGAYLYLLDSLGNLITTVGINSGNVDWEDISIAKSPFDGKNYLFIGDIGDNAARRSLIRVIKMEEPKMNFSTLEQRYELNNYENIFIKYPDGPKDAETLIVDPLTLDIYIASKREFRTRVFVAEYPYKAGDTLSPEHIATLPFTTATAGDISQNGNEIVIRNYIKVYSWQREGNEKLKYTFRKQPLCLPLLEEAKGEGICFAHQNKGYITVSETEGFDFMEHTFNFYRRK